MTSPSGVVSTGASPRVAIIGLGGFAQVHHRALAALEKEGLCRLVAACDPAPNQFADFMAKMEFERRGLRVYDNYLRMLDAHASELDLVTIPTPIPLHAEMHRAAVERRITAYLEKPPSLDVVELAQMVEIDRAAVRPTVIGFQMISEPARRTMKRRIVEGEFGRVRRVSFLGLWPRSNLYYRRTSWAGRLIMDGRLVLDSCFGNAMSHYLNNCCHWAADQREDAWEPVAFVEAELYRAHPIEGPDTVFARGRFASGAELRLALTHACAGSSVQREVIECENAIIEYHRPDNIRILRPGVPPEVWNPPAQDPWQSAFREALAYVSGRSARPGQWLSESVPFVHLHALLYLSARHIRSVLPPCITISKGSKDDVFVAIQNIAEACEALVRDGLLPTEQRLPWAPPAAATSCRHATAADLKDLAAIVWQMAKERSLESMAPSPY